MTLQEMVAMVQQWQADHQAHWVTPCWVMSTAEQYRIKTDVGCICDHRGAPADAHEVNCLGSQPDRLWTVLGVVVRYDESAVGLRIEAK